MGRSPGDDRGLKKGPWTQEEDEKLISYIQKHGHGSWTSLPKQAGLNRCGKSCRLRWTNYLRPDIKRGRFSEEEEQMIIKLHSVLGNKWSRIAGHLAGRTDNEVKNYWNTHLRKKLLQMGIDPITHKPRTDLNLLSNLSQLLSLPMNSTMATTMVNNQPYDMNALRLQYSSAAELAKLQVMQNIIQILNTSTSNPSNSITDQSATLLGLSSEPNNQQMIEKLLACSNNTAFNSEFLGANVAKRSETEHGGTIFSSWGGGSDEERACLQEIMEMNSYEQGCSSGQQAPVENKLPGLVSVSSVETLSFNGKMASNPNSNHGSFQNLPDYEFFDGCEKLVIDDGASDFFWKDLLN
ncbi:hypothetical protein V2J09_014789 [Rumex salicifolius]